MSEMALQEAYRRCGRLTKERDDREKAARELLSLLQSSAADHEHDELLFEQWPWLRPAEAEDG